MSFTEEVAPKRYSVKQVMLQTAIASLLFAALFHENEWLRAILFTVTVGMIFNEILAIIYATGNRRAFAIGHSIAVVFFPLCYWGVTFSLPYLLTMKLLNFMKLLQNVNEENFWIVAAIFWTHVTCRSSGYLAVLWNRSSNVKQLSES